MLALDASQILITTILLIRRRHKWFGVEAEYQGGRRGHAEGGQDLPGLLAEAAKGGKPANEWAIRVNDRRRAVNTSSALVTGTSAILGDLRALGAEVVNAVNAVNGPRTWEVVAVAGDDLVVVGHFKQQPADGALA